MTLPPGGVRQVLLAEQHSRLILETDGPNHHRCEAIAAVTPGAIKLIQDYFEASPSVK